MRGRQIFVSLVDYFIFYALISVARANIIGGIVVAKLTKVKTMSEPKMDEVRAALTEERDKNG